MASWMIHLRVADRLLEQLPKLLRREIAEKEFIVGNIAPDSGIPVDDWNTFIPSGEESHFKNRLDNGSLAVNERSISDYVAKHFTPGQQQGYSKEAYSFYLGYLTHLLTDMEWLQKVYRVCAGKHPEAYATDKKAFIATVKKDWYDLDFLYLKNHPDFRAFCIYEDAVGFENHYMDIFAKDAFDNRRAYITGWYRGGKDNLERHYPYFTEEEAAQFIENASETILKRLPSF